MLVFVISFFCLYLLDKKINSVLLPYINVEVERLVNNIVNKTISEEMARIDINSIIVRNDVENTLSYDTKAINVIDNKITKKIQNKLKNIDNGEIDEFYVPVRVKNGRFKNIKNGILCDISVGSLRSSTLFSNVGPTIPIKLLFSSQLNSNIDIEVNEYGINNAIMKVYFSVEIKEQITMPLTSKRQKIKIKKPLTIDIVQGKIPDYYNGYLK